MNPWGWDNRTDVKMIEMKSRANLKGKRLRIQDYLRDYGKH